MTCECGCGGTPKPGKRFVHGHHRRGKKLSEATRRKIGLKSKAAWERDPERMTSGGPGAEATARMSRERTGKGNPMYGRVGAAHPNWRSLDECSYDLLHQRLIELKPKTGVCERCERTPATFSGPGTSKPGQRKTATDYAYIGMNGRWSGDPDAYMELCRSCHLKLDKSKSDDPIHESVLVHPTALIADGAHIGEGTIVRAGAVITGYARIGRRCVIGENAVIGTAGFGYSYDKSVERFVRRPHPFHVIIGDDCEIAGTTSVDRGRWRDTVIGDGTKIDHHVHIAHNVVIGRNCLIIAHAMLAGSVTVDDDVQVSPGALIRDHCDVGRDSHVGQGANVVKHVPPKTLVAGNPAQPFQRRKEDRT